MAINSRAKGAAGERELAGILRDYGYKARRGQQFSGANGDADVLGLPNCHIECKRVQALNIDKAMDQSIRDARGGEFPTVMHRKNGRPWLVTLRLEDFIEIYREWESGQYLKAQGETDGRLHQDSQKDNGVLGME